MELTKERLEEMAAVDIRTVDISTLTDLRDIEIDTSCLWRRSWMRLQGRRTMSMSIGSVIM